MHRLSDLIFTCMLKLGSPCSSSLFFTIFEFLRVAPFLRNPRWSRLARSHLCRGRGRGGVGKARRLPTAPGAPLIFLLLCCRWRLFPSFQGRSRYPGARSPAFAREKSMLRGLVCAPGHVFPETIGVNFESHGFPHSSLRRLLGWPRNCPSAFFQFARQRPARQPLLGRRRTNGPSASLRRFLVR